MVTITHAKKEGKEYKDTFVASLYRTFTSCPRSNYIEYRGMNGAIVLRNSEK